MKGVDMGEEDARDCLRVLEYFRGELMREWFRGEKVRVMGARDDMRRWWQDYREGRGQSGNSEILKNRKAGTVVKGQGVRKRVAVHRRSRGRMRKQWAWDGEDEDPGGKEPR